MSAAVISAPGEIKMVRCPIPNPRTDEILIRVESCGVCASNLPRWQGRPWFDYPSKPGELGHEGNGVVVAVGDGVHEWEPGERVTYLSNSAYAEYDIAKAREAVRIPTTLRDVAVPGEPLGCACNIFRRADIRRGDTVAIVGVGFLGAILIQLAKSRGVRVFAISRREYALTVAAACGADAVYSSSSGGDEIAAAAEFTGGSLFDVVIEAGGKQSTLDLAARLVRERGRLVVAGFHQDGPRTVDMQSWNWRGIDVVNAHERDPAEYVRGMSEALGAVCEGIIDPSPLITHLFPLSKLGEALELTASRPDGFVKAIVAP